MNNFVKEIKYFIEDIKNWKNLSPNPIKRRFYSFQENRYYIKNKSCCACQHFNWFMGCADVCEIKKEEAIEGFNVLKKNPFYIRNDSNDTHSRFDLLDYTITIEKVQVTFTNNFN